MPLQLQKLTAENETWQSSLNSQDLYRPATKGTGVFVFSLQCQMFNVLTVKFSPVSKEHAVNFYKLNVQSWKKQKQYQLNFLATAKELICLFRLKYESKGKHNTYENKLDELL